MHGCVPGCLLNVANWLRGFWILSALRVGGICVGAWGLVVASWNDVLLGLLDMVQGNAGFRTYPSGWRRWAMQMGLLFVG